VVQVPEHRDEAVGQDLDPHPRIRLDQGDPRLVRYRRLLLDPVLRADVGQREVEPHRPGRVQVGQHTAIARRQRLELERAQQAPVVGRELRRGLHAT
jgi:hypothetical protein